MESIESITLLIQISQFLTLVAQTEDMFSGSNAFLMRHWCCKDEFLCTRQCPKNTNHDNKSPESCIDNNQEHDHR